MILSVAHETGFWNFQQPHSGLPWFLDNRIDLINGNTTTSAPIIYFALDYIHGQSGTTLHSTVVNFKTIMICIIQYSHQICNVAVRARA